MKVADKVKVKASKVNAPSTSTDKLTPMWKEQLEKIRDLISSGQPLSQSSIFNTKLQNKEFSKYEKLNYEVKKFDKDNDQVRENYWDKLFRKVESDTK